MSFLLSLLGELFKQLLCNLPALLAGVRQANVTTIEDAAPAAGDPALQQELTDALQNAIDRGDVPPPGPVRAGWRLVCYRRDVAGALGGCGTRVVYQPTAGPVRLAEDTPARVYVKTTDGQWVKGTNKVLLHEGEYVLDLPVPAAATPKPTTAPAAAATAATAHRPTTQRATTKPAKT